MKNVQEFLDFLIKDQEYLKQERDVVYESIKKYPNNKDLIAMGQRITHEISYNDRLQTIIKHTWMELTNA